MTKDFRLQKEDDAYGDARLASEAEVTTRTGTRRPRSLLLGRVYDDQTKRAGVEIIYNGDRHLLLFGPNGSGKGVRFLLPNLLRSFTNQSVVVIDPKGELAFQTADYRRSLGHNVLILNPFDVLGLGSAGFNPLASLDPTAKTFYDDAAGIAEALIKVEGSEPHWSESAQGLLTALIMWEKKQEGDKATLEHVRYLLTEPEETKDDKDENGKSYKRLSAGFLYTAAQMATSGDYAIESLSSRFTRENDEMASVRSNADTQTRWLLSSPMAKDVRKNGIDFSKLKDKPTTVYIVLPAERLRTHSAWLRMVIVSALRSLYRPGGLRTIMLLDEMAALGHLPPIEDAFGLVRGYRVQIAAIFQDLNQLKDLYKDRWETFVANAGVVFGFAPNDLTTADWMSKNSGQMTAFAYGATENTGTSLGHQVSTSSGVSASSQPIARPLFLPQELRGFESGMGLTWIEGLRFPIKFFAPFYNKIAECDGRWKMSPYYVSDDD